jgi:hypothetical protein
MVITKEGKFGFGLSVPSEKFHFKGNTLFEGETKIKGKFYLEELKNMQGGAGILITDVFGQVKHIDKDRFIEYVYGKDEQCFITSTQRPSFGRWFAREGFLYSCPDVFVGLGTATPKARLQVEGDAIIVSRLTVGRTEPTSQYSIDVNGRVNATDFLINGVSIVNSTTGGGTTSGQWAVSGNNISYSTGNVGIGKSNPTDYKLEVCGTIKASQVRVNATGCDFVFDDNYALPSLAERKGFIEENKHLPYIKPAKDMQENGMDLTEATEGLLQNLEEMTLHQIRLEEKIVDLSGLVKVLLKEIEDQKKEIVHLKLSINN